MIVGASTSFASAFLASFVEAVEALTIVLAAGVARGWRPALAGASAALLLLVGLTGLGGPFLQILPVRIVRLALGSFLLLLGLKWLRKAILRAAGVIPKRDEKAAFARTEARLRSPRPQGRRFDLEGFVTAFNAVLLEGIEIVLIVLSLGAAGNALRWAGSGAAAAYLSVLGLGLLLHRPLTHIPENWLKFIAGILLADFGLFWLADGLGLPWPGGDLALPGLFIVISGLSLIAVLAIRKRISPSR